jgi:hypothetical protein
MAVTLNASTTSGFVQSADTSGEINLQSNGSTKLTVASTGVSGTLVQGTAVASTSGTSIDFTSIPSWVKRITVMLNGVSGNGTSNLLVQLGDSGGVETTGYISAAAVPSATTAAATSTAGLIITVANSASDVWYGSVILTLVDSNNWTSIASLTNSAGVRSSAGFKSTSATLDRVRITTVNGTDTFDAGTINIQYEG